MKLRGKPTAISSAIIGIVILAVAGLAARGRIREEWYLRKLDNGTEQERGIAAEVLGTMRSERAVPLLLDGIKRDQLSRLKRKVKISGSTIAWQTMLSPQGERFRHALIRIGKPATLALLKAIKEWVKNWDHSQSWVGVHPGLILMDIHERDELGSCGKEHANVRLSIFRVIRGLKNDPAQEPEVREVAGELLELDEKS